MKFKITGIIHDWSTVPCGSDFAAPEVRGIAVQGKIYGHAVHADGTGVCTSRVVDVNGRIVTTQSGSIYQLGRIAPAFREWLRTEGRTYDPRQPITVRTTVPPNNAARRKR